MSASVDESQQQKAEFIPTRNYTGPYEKDEWWWVIRRSRDYKYYYGSEGNDISKQLFRYRRASHGVRHCRTQNQALRANIGNNNDIGVFVRLTNGYALIGGEEESENFSSFIKNDLPEIPVIKSSIGGCRIVGRMCVGNKYGLLVPDTIYNTELEQLIEELPDRVEVKRLEERLSALGNVVACNDHVALIHPDLDKESEEIIKNTLQVEVFRHLVNNYPLVGSYCVLNNHGGLVHVDINNGDLENLSSLLELSLVGGTVNSGNKVVASGLAVNDTIAYAGMKTTSKEFTSIEKAFQLK